MDWLNDEIHERYPDAVTRVVDLENITATMGKGCHVVVVLHTSKGTQRVPGWFDWKNAANGKPISTWAPDYPQP